MDALMRELAPACYGRFEPPAGEAAPELEPRDFAEAHGLARDGYAILAPGIRGPSAAAPLADAVTAAVAAGLPAVCVYMTDLVWAVGEALRARLSTILRSPYVLLDDAWAWSIAPRHGRGWAPHRGTTAFTLDRAAPELVNVWVALTDATADRSCMYVIPLDEDPSYPLALDRADGPLAAVRALPVTAGTALVWNANMLHWGGPCTERAAGPRISCSFSLAAPSAIERVHGYPIDPAVMTDVAARADLVAAQIATYGPGQQDVPDEALAWARATCALRALRPQRKAP